MFPSIVKNGIRQLLWCAMYVASWSELASWKRKASHRANTKAFCIDAANEALADFDETFK